MESASGCVSQSLERAWALRVLVVRLQFLQWESEQMRRSGLEPNGQDREVGPPSFLGRGVEVLIGGCGMCREEM